MFLIRRARIEDVGTLLKLARMVHFINLPPDKDIITAKVLHSRSCFIRVGGGTDAVGEVSERRVRGGGSRTKAQDRIRPQEDPTLIEAHRRHLDNARRGANGTSLMGFGSALVESDLFMFTLEDTETQSVLGTSQIVAHMGGPGNPSVAFRLRKREFFSTSLQSGTTHMTATLHLDESGPTEIGGLILQPSYRRHKQKLGRFLSLVRFHFIGLHRELFADRVTAEMMAPITPDGQNLFWDCLGRRFIALNYSEADRFCQYSREFMISLLPREEIYLSLLPPEARAMVAQVGPETVPARKLLEGLGFAHKDLIDPFDGGPYLTADTSKVTLVRDTRWAELGSPAAASRCKRFGYVSRLDEDGEFRAVQTAWSEDTKGRLGLPAEAHDVIAADPGARVGVTPTDGGAAFGDEAQPGKRSARSARKARS